MNDINYVILTGRLTSDPTYKVIQNGNSLSTFSIANNRRYKKQSGEVTTETSFINCTAWGRLSDFSKSYLRKGMLIVVEGRLKQNSWQTEEGKNQSSLNVIVNNIQILTQKANVTSENPSQKMEEALPDIETTEDDIPF
ncbi:MAG: single-stranded DNA-binding protein [Leptonema sp. (in: bacteria)]